MFSNEELMRETRELEFKETVSDTFLKTVSAFANYNGGSILFGVDDSGRAVGIDDPVEACLAIENKIHDCISPQPNFSLNICWANSTIELKVAAGRSKPYYFKSKAYKRNDASTREVDSIELTRLILEGENITFEQLAANSDDFEFTVLETALKRELKLQAFSKDTLKTLELFSDENGYNNAAALLADRNSFPGIDIAVFGESISVIRKRFASEKKSVLAEFDEAINFFRDYYCPEVIDGPRRKNVELIPLAAFREAIANAIVHRTWDVEAHIRVAMFEDRIEVTSPGGLPTGISEEEYLCDAVSIRRNPILAQVFYRLGIIEAFGTGVQKIKDAYADSLSKPRFSIMSNAIAVTLPVTKKDMGLNEDQRQVYDLLNPYRAIASGELIGKVEFSRTKLNLILKGLIELNLIEAVGTGRGKKYRKLQ